jgi:hypothetical protein
LPFATLDRDDDQVDRDRRDHHGVGDRPDVECDGMLHARKRAHGDLAAAEEQHARDAERGDGLVLAVAVRMVGVRRPARDADADDADDVRRRRRRANESVAVSASEPDTRP